MSIKSEYFQQSQWQILLFYSPNEALEEAKASKTQKIKLILFAIGFASASLAACYCFRVRLSDLKLNQFRSLNKSEWSAIDVKATETKHHHDSSRGRGMWKFPVHKNAFHCS